MNTPALVATCWTSAGNVAPLDDPEVSPFAAIDRVRAVASTGWAGIGFAQGDLQVVRETIGFPALRAEIEAAGLRHVEVELASGWWREDDLSWRGTWELLLEAAHELGASFIKIGTEFGSPVDDITPFVEPLRRIADEASAIGTRVALEPLPFALIGSMPQGADLIRAAGHPAAGLVVDFWHVFRADTTLAELVACLDPGMAFGVELCDAQLESIGTLFEDTRDRRTLRRPRRPGRRRLHPRHARGGLRRALGRRDLVHRTPPTTPDRGVDRGAGNNAGRLPAGGSGSAGSASV